MIPYFNTSVSEVINAVLRAEGRAERFGSWAMPGNIIPDFMVAVPNDESYSQPFLCGEAKVSSDLSSSLPRFGGPWF